jgi:hypothetical protein
MMDMCSAEYLKSCCNVETLVTAVHHRKKQTNISFNLYKRTQFTSMFITKIGIPLPVCFSQFYEILGFLFLKLGYTTN